MTTILSPVHPGEVLLTEFLEPMRIEPNQLGNALKVSARQIQAIVGGAAPVSADMALRLSRYFGTSAEFWRGLQMQYDLDVAEESLAPRLNEEITPYAQAG